MSLSFKATDYQELTVRTLNTANSLFEPVKRTTIDSRIKYPKILQNNNFTPVCLATATHIYLELIPKSKATDTKKRINIYQHVFSGLEDNSSALFVLNSSRSVCLYSLNLGTAPAIQLGSDVSVCLADINVSEDKNFVAHPVTKNVGLIYVIGFGRLLQGETIWRELDHIIRRSLFHWSRR